ncbi:nucleoside kinase, partial [Klebsiella oxytoca]
AAKVEFAIGAGYYCRFVDHAPLDDKQIMQVRERMKELTEADLPITKRAYPSEEAIRLFDQNGMQDKVKLFRYRRSSTINVYCLGD